VTSGARNAAIDHHAAAARGIIVCGTRGKDAAPAELTWALLLALLRRLPAEDAAIRAGRWGVHVGRTLEGRRLGILGYGDIGARAARYGVAFGMEVLAHSRSLTREAALAGGVSAVDRETLLRESDVVTLHLKLTPETAGTIGRRELGLMQRSAVLINTARGGAGRRAGPRRCAPGSHDRRGRARRVRRGAPPRRLAAARVRPRRHDPSHRLRHR
jgi:phosphoglycerate dehydrogenase-like enzyme